MSLRHAERSRLWTISKVDMVTVSGRPHSMLLIHRHRLGCAVVSYRCFDITPRCEPVAPGAKQKINGVAVLVQGAIQILPLPLDLDNRKPSDRIR
jgi:hypothetical protein